MPSLSGRGAGPAVNLYRLSALAQQVTGIARGRTAQADIVDTDARRVAVALYVAVKDDHGHAALIHLLDDGRKGSRLVGRHDEYVKLVFDKVADVGYLLRVAVIGRAYLDHRIVVEQYLTVYFIVHFGAPVILAALRYAYFILPGLAASGRTEQDQQHHAEQ